jgi:hypothetical protein
MHMRYFLSLYKSSRLIFYKIELEGLILTFLSGMDGGNQGRRNAFVVQELF